MKLKGTDFKSVALADRDLLVPYFQRHRQTLCQYTFPLFYGWNQTTYSYFYAIENNVLLLLAQSPTTGKRVLFKPIDWKTPYTSPNQVREFLIRTGVNQMFLLDMGFIDQFPRALWQRDFDLQYDREYADYCYRLNDLASLAGTKYAKKRNLIKQFKRLNHDRTVTITPIESHMTTDIIGVLDDWQIGRMTDNEDPELQRERVAIIRTMEAWSQLDQFGWLISLEEENVGFCICERLNANTAVTHFEKVVNKIKGLHQFFLQETAIRMSPDFEFLNRESDMGLAGLRQAKRSYHPHHLEQAFSLKLKSGAENL